MEAIPEALMMAQAKRIEMFAESIVLRMQAIQRKTIPEDMVGVFFQDVLTYCDLMKTSIDNIGIIEEED